MYVSVRVCMRARVCVRVCVRVYISDKQSLYESRGIAPYF